MIFQLQIDNSGENQSNIGNTILFEGEERLEEQFSELFEWKRSVRDQLVANVDVALAQHPPVTRTEFGGQVSQQRTEHH